MSTIKDKVHFTYNGKSTRDFGILSANLEGGMYEESFVAEQSIREEKLVDRRTTIFSGVEKEPLEFQLVLAFENNFTDETIEEVVEWLYGTEYYSKLEFEGMDKVYYCIPNGESTITHTGYQEGYITLSMRSNSPYVFGKMIDGFLDNDLNVAWSNSENGKVDFTKMKPNANLLKTVKDKEYQMSNREFINSDDWDVAPIVEKYGLDTYFTYTFEAKAVKDGTFNFYINNGSGAKYSFGKYKDNPSQINVTTEWKKYTIRTNHKIADVNEKNSKLAFYSTYDSGVMMTIRNMKMELGENSTIGLEQTPMQMKYIGYSKTNSDNYGGYKWTRLEQKSANAYNIKLKGKKEPESIIKIFQRSNGSITIKMNGHTVRINNLLKDETIKIFPLEEDIESDRINTYHYNDYIGDLSNLTLIEKETPVIVEGDCDIEYYYQPYYNK